MFGFYRHHGNAGNISDRRLVLFADRPKRVWYFYSGTSHLGMNGCCNDVGFFRRGLSVPVRNLVGGVRFLPTPRYFFSGGNGPGSESPPTTAPCFRTDSLLDVQPPKAKAPGYIIRTKWPPNGRRACRGPLDRRMDSNANCTDPSGTVLSGNNLHSSAADVYSTRLL